MKDKKEKIKVLAPSELSWSCDYKGFSFKTTKDVPSLKDIIGQERAQRSLDFGLGLENSGYNIYVLGESGTGKTSTVRARLEEKAADEATPSDWCYVYNFEDADKPYAIDLPPGVGIKLKAAASDLIETLKRDIPKVFESKDYEKHRDEILDGQQERTKDIFYRLEQHVKDKGFVLKKSVSGLAVMPADKEGKAISQSAFDALPKSEKAHVEEDLKQMQQRLSDAVREARSVEKDAKVRIDKLDREVVEYVVSPLVNELLEIFKEFKQVTEYIEKLREDVLENIEDFRAKEDVSLPLAGLASFKMPNAEPSFDRYSVNLLVNNKDAKGAPVVFEPNPPYYNLFGRIEHSVQYGVATTNFAMIKSGAVHRANGGYLVVNALDVLRNIFVYDAVKRMIKNKEVSIEDVWEQYRLVSTMTLKPGPIPLDVKVVMIGEPYIYYALYNMDKEYRKLFKVKADFDNRMDRSPENIDCYAGFVADRCRERNLIHFDPSGVAGVVEYGARLAADKEKLSARFGEIENVVVEASYWAGVEGEKKVKAEHIDKAVNEMVYRNSKIEERLREYITEDTIMVDTEGEVVGQVNGLAVLDPGDYAFGKPSRVTAITFMGDGGLVNIEREAKMSGRIYNKAHMILSGFIGERFAKYFPLTLSANICFEQLYEGIEGDSATCAELYALLSSLANKPISQGIAVTGSMNQLGEVQPIGGVNVKIEGFYEVCKAKGLTGEQGVIIPSRNVRHLMLKKEVRDAVAAGKFAVYPIDDVNEGLEILTGMSVGVRGDNGKFPEKSLSSIVEKKLHALAKSYKAFGRPKRAADVKKPSDDNNNNNSSKG